MALSRGSTLPRYRGDERQARQAQSRAGLVTPHLLRIVELADSAQKGANVEWHVRGAVSRTMGELGGQANASERVAAYLEGLDNAAVQAPNSRMQVARVLKAAAEAARRPRRD